MMGWREYWIGLVISGWYVGDVIHSDITHKSSTYHLNITHISRYHPHIIQISTTYHPVVTQISSKYHPVDIFYNPPTWKKVSFNPYMARLLPVKTPLLNSIKTPLLIIQISSRYHPEIIQISSWWKVES